MRRPWRSRPLRGIPAAPSWPPFPPQRAGCRQETPACGIVLLMWCCLRFCLFARGTGVIKVVHREFSARQATGSFSLSVQAAGLRGLRQPLNNPGGRQPSLFLRLSLRPDGPSGCAVPGAAVLCAASCRSVLASVPSSARRMPAGNPCLWDRVTDVVWCCLRICLFGRGAGDITVLHREFSARQATGSFSLSVQAAGLRGSRQPLNNPGGRQPSLFLRLSLRPDGPSGCAVPGAAVLCAASLPLRPGLRSLLSAPDAGRKPLPVGSCY